VAKAKKAKAKKPFKDRYYVGEGWPDEEIARVIIRALAELSDRLDTIEEKIEGISKKNG
tara:strand:- start:102 stop:278 length:177 start_codon:yes stop_codon:yes gene_type:complete